MKKYIASLSLALAATAFFMACDDEEDPQSPAGKGGSAGQGGGGQGGGGNAGKSGAGGSAGRSGGGGNAGSAGGGPKSLPNLCVAPESVYYDSVNKGWYVSCINEFGTDPDGYIAKLSDDGKSIVTEKYIAGLRDPKGIRTSPDGKLLYVTDIDELVTVDISDPASPGTPTRVSVLGGGGAAGAAGAAGAGGSAGAAGAGGAGSRPPFLNDIAVDKSNGKIYVSDTFNDRIYGFKAGGTDPELLATDKRLEAPNGLLIEGKFLFIASLGPEINPDTFETKSPGHIARVAVGLVDRANGKAIPDPTPILEPAEGKFRYISNASGHFDGIELLSTGKANGPDDDVLIVSGNPESTIYSLSANGTDASEPIIVRSNFTQPADIGFDPARNLLGVPELALAEPDKAKVVFIDLTPPPP